jgi:hypothetical protein
MDTGQRFRANQRQTLSRWQPRAAACCLLLAACCLLHQRKRASIGLCRPASAKAPPFKPEHIGFKHPRYSLGIRHGQLTRLVPNLAWTRAGCVLTSPLSTHLRRRSSTGCARTGYLAEMGLSASPRHSFLVAPARRQSVWSPLRVIAAAFLLLSALRSVLSAVCCLR